MIFEGAWHTRAHDAELPGPVAQVLSGLGEDPLFLEATALTAVNDTALIASREARSASR